jgi:hypothetical protein
VEFIPENITVLYHHAANSPIYITFPSGCPVSLQKLYIGKTPIIYYFKNEI